MMNKLKGYILTFICCLLICLAPWVRGGELSPLTTHQVQRAHQLLRDDSLADAIQLLEAIDSPFPYDKAYVQRMLGDLYWRSEQADPAIQSLTLAVDSAALPGPMQKETQRMLADILLQQGDYVRAELCYRHILPLYTRAEELETVWLRIAQAQYHQQEWAGVEKSLDKQQHYLAKAGRQAGISPLTMLLTVRVAQEKWRDAIGTAKKLRELEPENQLWWQQLVVLYLRNNEYKKALTTLAQTERAGFTLSARQLKLLASLYARQGMPYKAAQAYARLDNLQGDAELLAQQATYWQEAREWRQAGQSWRRAAELDGRYYWHSALLSLRLREYQVVLEQVDKLPRQTAESLLVKAQAYRGMGDNTQALRMATESHRLNATEESASWIRYLEGAQ